MGRRALRLALGAVAAPFAGYVTAVLLVTLPSWLGNPSSIPVLLLYALAFTVRVGWPAMLLLGLPLHALLMRCGARNWLAYSAAGASAGALITAIAFVAANLHFGDRYLGAASDVLQTLPLGVAAGALTGGGFWLIRRPDRDSINAPRPAA